MTVDKLDVSKRYQFKGRLAGPISVGLGTVFMLALSVWISFLPNKGHFLASLFFLGLGLVFFFSFVLIFCDYADLIIDDNGVYRVFGNLTLQRMCWKGIDHIKFYKSYDANSKKWVTAFRLHPYRGSAIKMFVRRVAFNQNVMNGSLDDLVDSLNFYVKHNGVKVRISAGFMKWQEVDHIYLLASGQ